MSSIRQEKIAEIRHSYGLSQRYFALLLGISVRTLQNWEIGHRIPCGPANALLNIADKKPQAFKTNYVNLELDFGEYDVLQKDSQ